MTEQPTPLLRDRVAIVTGAGTGLGRSHARTLARYGAAVVVNDIGGAVDGTGASAAAEAVAAEIRGEGGRAVSNRDSVASPEGGQAIVEQAAAEFGSVDIVVANAGIVRTGAYEDFTADDFRALIDVHLGGAFWVTQAAYRRMKAAGYGRVVFTSSGAGLYGQPDSVGYVAAKAAVAGLMRALSIEGEPRGVLANAIAPIAYTRMTAEAFGPELAHLARPEWVTELVAYLTSSRCTTTGRLIEVGAATYAGVFTGRTTGIEFDADVPIDAATLAGRYEEIFDATRYTTPKSSMEAIASAFGGPFEYGGTHRNR
jgi:NAD(P)-dependent dehydrogenase (short-subunit alcohol dehydrogenase family)